MIDRKQLRIGNLLRVGNNPNVQKIIEVEEIRHNSVTCRWEEGMTDWEYDYKELFPIELTPEWLGKCGFKNVPIGSTGYKLNEVAIFDFNDDGIYKMWNYKGEIKFVHQLQNLYYFLTGDDLIIKQ